VPAGDAWLHELKLDGYRLQVIKEGRQVRLYSRRGHEWTARLPGPVEELVGIHCRSAIIDAELCLPGAGGVPDFYGLHLRMRYRRSELLVYGFDLLHRDGRDLRALPLTERRRHLERLVEWSDMPCLRLVEAFADGGQLLEVAEQHRLEGVVGKRKASAYRSGPSRDWRKNKTAGRRKPTANAGACSKPRGDAPKSR
jgi:bifunctional non-homologous end joining protein LigD